MTRKLDGAQPWLSLLMTSLLLAGTLFVFGPATLYLGNASGFQISLAVLLKYCGLAGLLACATLLALGAAVPRRWRTGYAAVVFGLGLLIWVQGNLMVWKYGLLDGQGYDWSKGSWRGLDLIIWITVLVAVVLLRKKIARTAVLVSAFLILGQAASLGVQFRQYAQNSAAEHTSLCYADEGIAEFSSGVNIIHIILDAFQSNIFEELTIEKTGLYARKLEGFTFFRDAVGAYPTTMMSIPAILKAATYRNEVPMRQFLDKSMRTGTLPDVLKEQGFQVDIVENPFFFRSSAQDSCRIPTPYFKTRRQFEMVNTAFLLDLALFRAVPHSFKKFIYRNQSWLLYDLIGKGQGGTKHEPLSHRAFFEEFIDNIAAEGKRNTYKFIHFYFTHAPIVLNEECRYAGGVLPYTYDKIKTQSRCGFEQFVRFMDKMRSLGIYDSSLIILQADHGAGQPVAVQSGEGENGGYYVPDLMGYANALLAIKPPGAKGALRVSGVQAELRDIPATVSSIMHLNADFPGEPLFGIPEDQVRDRSFYNYWWRHENWQGDFFDRLDEFVIRGPAKETNSWQLREVHLSPQRRDRLEVGKIHFGADNDSDFLVAGWGGPEVREEGEASHRWALGRRSAVVAGLPLDGFSLLTARIKSLPENYPQTINVLIDGEQVEEWKLLRDNGWEERHAIVHPNGRRQTTSIIEFGFSRHSDRPEDSRPLSVAFEFLTIQQIDTYQWGREIVFGQHGDSRPYERGGWSEPEIGLTWIDGQSAGLHLPIAKPKASKGRLTATLAPFLADGRIGERRVEVMINGEKTGEWVLSTPGFQARDLLFPMELLSDRQSMMVSFEIPDAVSPLSLGYNEDTRVLGVAFKQIRMDLEQPSGPKDQANREVGL